MDISRRKRIPSEKKATLQNPSIIESPLVGWKIAMTDHRGQVKTFDFSVFAEQRMNLARHFLDAFSELRIELKTRIQYISGFRKFWLFLDYLDHKNIHIETLEQIDISVIEEYLLWLRLYKTEKGSLLSQKAQRSTYEKLKKVLRWLLVYRRNECSANLFFPSHVFSQTAICSKSRDPYSKNELNCLMKAIESELKEINRKIENPYVLQKIGRDPRIRYSSDLKSWNNLVWYFEAKLDQKRRTTTWLHEHGHGKFVYSAYKYHNGIKAVWKRLGIINNIYVPQNIKKEPKLDRAPWRNWENMVWYFENVLNCECKSVRWLDKNGHSSFRDGAINYHGGLLNVLDRLGVWAGTSQQVLLPFLLLFAILTGANPEPILEMKRDCIKEDALIGNKYVLWYKRRGKSIHRSWSSAARMVVERVLELTKEFVADAGIYAEYLWLVRDPDGTVRRLHVVQPEKFNNFLGKYNLKADDGSPLKIHVSRFRPTFASRAFELCDGDLIKLRTLMGHKHISTTQKYVHNFDKQKEEERAYKGLTSLSEAIQNGSLISRYAEEIGVPEEHVLRSLESHKLYTGLGQCLDPYKSPIKGEKAETRCSHFWSCLTCRHTLVMEGDLPDIFSHYYNLEKFRKHMSSEAFEETYGWILKIIDCDIAPKFEKSVVETARKKALESDDTALNLHEMLIGELEKE